MTPDGEYAGTPEEAWAVIAAFLKLLWQAICAYVDYLTEALAL
jgi:hypothetical protein